MTQQPPDGLGATIDKPNIEKIPVSDEVKARALEKIRTAVQGNGYKPEDVILEKFDGEVLQFTTRTVLEIRTKLSEKTKPGKSSEQQQVPGEAGLKAAIEHEYQKLITSRDMSRRIREVILTREDRGFAIDNVFIPLPFTRKDFVYYEGCKVCGADGKVTCKPCNGTGHATCMACQGRGQIPGANNKLQKCPKCSGKGETPCLSCKGKAQTQCPNCYGKSYFSKITIVDFEVRTKFEYDRDRVPTKVALMLDELGPDLTQHAIVHPVQLEHYEEQDEAEKKLSLHFIVNVPYGHFEFKIGGETYYSFLFGHTAKLTYTSSFIDKLISNGSRKLKDAADQRGDVLENMDIASKFKTVRQAIVAASRFPPAKAAKLLIEATPLGLSKARAEELTRDADTAIQNLTRKPRQIALVASILGAFALYLLYFLGLRELLPIQSIALMVLDALIATAGIFLAGSLVQIWTLQILKKKLQMVPEKKIKPRTGKSALYARIGAGVLFLASLEIAHKINAAPDWYQALHNLL